MDAETFLKKIVHVSGGQASPATGTWFPVLFLTEGNALCPRRHCEKRDIVTVGTIPVRPAEVEDFKIPCIRKFRGDEVVVCRHDSKPREMTKGGILRVICDNY